MRHQYAIYRLDDWTREQRDGPKTIIRGQIDSWEDALLTAAIFERTRPDQIFLVLNHPA